MPTTLKVYYIANLDGRNSRVVAAPNRKAGAEAMRCRPATFVNGAVEIDEDHSAYAAAMRTPGISWTRPIAYDRYSPPWRCLHELEGAKAIVRERFPEAALKSGCTWHILDGLRGRELGRGPTESAAWLAAARVLETRPPDGLPPNAVVVWRFADAPEQFRGLLRDNGGWVTFVPANLVDAYACWAAAERFPITGGEVWIGSR